MKEKGVIITWLTYELSCYHISNFIRHSVLRSNFITEELEQDSIVTDSRNIQCCCRIGSLTFQDVD